MMMHANQIELTVADVRTLLRDQLPQWSDSEIRPVSSHGTVAALFRIGDDRVARFPLVRGDSVEVEAEVRRELDAARRLAGLTRFATPEPVALGEPAPAYPQHWAVFTWLDGDVVTSADVSGSVELARDLAEFVTQVHAMPTEGRTFEGDHRGGVLGDHDAWVRHSIDNSRELMDAAALTQAWEELVALPREAPDVWCHQDLMPGNLLTDGTHLTGVIDVGMLGVADPAVDLQPAWNLLEPVARQAFRDALDVDDLTWERGRAWAFAQAIGCLWYYVETNPPMSQLARTTLAALLDESRG
ncbi:aminoglycoside phosphotransferase [Luteipulveratus halotolerans]|uniref:Aminoglycoside phosphotransferase n=1 Tax=Luteipulveratus halotolerans TaxID=1631356 RepID=A0A0L6CPH2_9MICO|nr:aminoglycoside phosphotransferase [Luteipulveratus halotolerans]